MKKIFLMPIALMCFMIMACSSKSSQNSEAAAESDALMTQEAAAESDPLMTQEAVASQVEKVYDYLNTVRQYYIETPPDKIDYNKYKSPYDEFCSKGWMAVYQKVDSIDKECECSGFFDFGERGPLDGWQYDCFEGTVSAQDIKVTLQDDGTAIVDFKIKDLTTINPVPLRWRMVLEDGTWKVADIIFVLDDNLDLLEEMKKYVKQGGRPAADY